MLLHLAILGGLVLILALVAASIPRLGKRLLYSDADHTTLWPARALRSPCFGLVAKPDYVYREDGQIVVEELKSGRVRSAPYTHHLIQLGVELLVVEQAFGRRPVAGRLRYANRTVPVAYTEDLRQQVLAALRRYRSVVGGKELPLPTSDTAKCRSCAVRELCQAGLADHH